MKAFDGRGDDARIWLDLESRVRRLERNRGHTESKTFIVGGEVDAGLYIPPYCLAVDPNDNVPETKYLYAVTGNLREGSLTVSWFLNDLEIVNTSVTAGFDAEANLIRIEDVTDDGEMIEVHSGDWLRPEVGTVTGAFDVSFSAWMLTSPA